MDWKSRSYPLLKPTAVVEWNLPNGSRAAMRTAFALKWLDESPYTNYRYNVERCTNGKRLYLLRPTWLNKGFDFQVNVEGFRSVTRTAKGQTKEMPSHTDVAYDLQLKLQVLPDLADSLFDAICNIYEGTEPNHSLDRDSTLASTSIGLPIDELLHIIKWLFIEQDLTYWLQTGRDMLMAKIESEVFGIKA
jgi:hypothetical protein